MTELKYLKNIAMSLDGIHKELRRRNELAKQENNLLASGFMVISSTTDEVLRDEIIGDMETGQSDEV